MLPDILKIAEEYGVSIDPKSIGRKEIMAHCPFCNSGKNHLSLNTEKKLFKCWYCSESGGVLQFEAKLSGKTFNEVRAKYFGSKKKSNHPAYDLSPNQLKAIGWHEKKRDSYNVFAKSKEEVVKDWKAYVYEEYVKYYALFTLIKHYPFPDQIKLQYGWYLKEIEKSEIENIKETIEQSYKNNLNTSWMERGKDVARIAYKACLLTNDEHFINLYYYVLEAIQQMKEQKG